jgi:hypothetical protein
MVLVKQWEMALEKVKVTERERERVLATVLVKVQVMERGLG